MKYSIFALLLICCLLFIEDATAVFTRDDCQNCCRGLTVNASLCITACVIKFSSSQDYNSREDCNRSCLIGLSGCRDRCYDDCTERYDPGIPGIRPPTRPLKEKRKQRAEQDAAGANRFVYDPNAPKKIYKKRKKKDKEGEGGGAAT